VLVRSGERPPVKQDRGGRANLAGGYPAEFTMTYLSTHPGIVLLAAALAGFVSASFAAWTLFRNSRSRRMEEYEGKFLVMEMELHQAAAKTKEFEALAAAAKVATAQSKTLEDKLASRESAAKAQLSAKTAEVLSLSARFEEANSTRIRTVEALTAAKAQLESELATQGRAAAQWRDEMCAAAVEQQSRIVELERKLSESNAAISMLREEATGASTQRVAAEAHARESEQELRKLLSLREEEYRTLQARTLAAEARQGQADEELGLVRERIAERDAEIARLRADLFERNESASALEADSALLAHLRRGMRERQTRIEGLEIQLRKAREEAAAGHARDGELQSLAGALADRDRQIQLLEQSVFAASASPQRTVQAQAELETVRNEEIARLEAGAALLSGQLQQARAEIADREERIGAWECRYEALAGEMHAQAGRMRMEMGGGEPAETHRGLAYAAAAGVGIAVEAQSQAQAASHEEQKPAELTELQARLRLAALRGIQFLPHSDEILPESDGVLEEALEALRLMDPALQVEVGGHTDSWGDAAHNHELSFRRAQAVCRYLVDRGVHGHRLVAAGYGDTRPVESNESPDGRFANRRIEFRVLGTVR
jgi:outer membrane protein OmpA-like peptidoglycan-associated protein